MKRKKSGVKKQLSEKQKLAQVRNSNKGRIYFIQGTLVYLLKKEQSAGLTGLEQEVLKEMILICQGLISNWKPTIED